MGGIGAWGLDSLGRPLTRTGQQGGGLDRGGGKEWARKEGRHMVLLGEIKQTAGPSSWDLRITSK